MRINEMDKHVVNKDFSINMLMLQKYTIIV